MVISTRSVSAQVARIARSAKSPLSSLPEDMLVHVSTFLPLSSLVKLRLLDKNIKKRVDGGRRYWVGKSVILTVDVKGGEMASKTKEEKEEEGIPHVVTKLSEITSLLRLFPYVKIALYWHRSLTAGLSNSMCGGE